jgi:hypothetical protein
MAVKERVYSRKFEDYGAIRGEVVRRFGYKKNLEGAYEGDDGRQQYSFLFNLLEDGISSVTIRKCGNEEAIENLSDIEKFLKDVGFLPRTSE